APYFRSLTSSHIIIASLPQDAYYRFVFLYIPRGMQYIHLILRLYGNRGIKSNTFPLCVFCMPSAQGLVLSLLMGAVFGGITLYLYRTENGAFYFGALLSVLMLAVILLAIDVPYLLYTGEL